MTREFQPGASERYIDISTASGAIEDWKYTKRGLAAGLTFAAALLMANDSGATKNKQPQPPAPLDELQVLVIQDQNEAYDTLKYTQDYIEQEIDQAGDYLAGMTAGKVTTPEDIDFHTIKLLPDSLHTNTETDESAACYSDDQLYRARTQYLENTAQHAASRTAIVINEGISCRGYRDGVSGWATTWPTGGNTTVYESFDSNIVMHEEGHIEGLNHAASIDCENTAGVFTTRDISGTDIAELIPERCTAVRIEGQNSIDHYSNSNTVMGGVNNHLIDEIDDRYSFVEKNILAPDVIKNKNVGTEAATYTLRLQDYDLQMVTFTLPEKHPLHEIDKKIEKISIGLNELGYGDGKSTEVVRIIAIADGQTYSLDYSFPYVPEFDATKQDLEIYHDETLGIKLIVNPGKQDRSVEVAVVPIE